MSDFEKFKEQPVQTNIEFIEDLCGVQNISSFEEVVQALSDSKRRINRYIMREIPNTPFNTRMTRFL